MRANLGSVVFAAVVGVAVGLAVACGVDVDISKKACSNGKCGDGYVCDTASQPQLCVTTLPSATTTTTGTTTAPPPGPVCDPCKCATSADCKDKTRPFCDVASTTCVECNPKDDTCPEARYCNEQFQCTAGCKTSAECVKLSPGSPTCALDRHQCVVCIVGVDEKACTGATKCTPSGTCVATCTGTGPCGAPGERCCGSLCIDTKSDRFNCGDCEKRCLVTNGTSSCTASKCTATCADGYKTCGPANVLCATPIRTDGNNCGDCGTVCNLANATGQFCAGGKCGYTACAPGFFDTDGDPTNGCEVSCGKMDQLCCPGSFCFDALKCTKQGNPANPYKCQ